ncbi:MAG: response regulator [Dehalococcoidia bacterium]|nr:response regulator [Dehalococcoidia bacterium]
MPPTILLVEDNPGDARLAKEALAEGNGSTQLFTVDDGAEALAYLERRAPYQNAIMPDLILLDLNLPRIDGREVLKYIKESESLRSIPVVVLTTSSSHEDIMNSYEQHANCYVTKPIELDEFFDTIHKIQSFWLHTAKLAKG